MWPSFKLQVGGSNATILLRGTSTQTYMELLSLRTAGPKVLQQKAISFYCKHDFI